MKSLLKSQKWGISILVAFFMVLSLQVPSYGQEVTRKVRLFYFLPNDQTYSASAVEDMKSGILKAQTFFREQMEAHGYGAKTFQIETDAQGDPIVHRVDGAHDSSYYADAPRPLESDEIAGKFDTNQIVQIVFSDLGKSRRVGGKGVGIKQRGKAVIYKWSWQTAAHELGHAFGLQHDFRDDAYMMSYGDNQNSLSTGAAHFLAVHPYFNQSIPLATGNLPSVLLSNSPDLFEPTFNHDDLHLGLYPYGSDTLRLRFRVRDPDGLHQVTLFAKTREGGSRGFHEVLQYRNLSGEANTVVEFTYDGSIPSDPSDLRINLLNRIKHLVYVSAVDKQGNRIDHPVEIKLYLSVKPAKVPVSQRSPRVRDYIYNHLRLFHDPNISSYDHITDAHLEDITSITVHNIRASDSPLQSNDFDGLTNLRSLELKFESGYSDRTLLPAGIFKGLTSLRGLSVKWYDTYGTDPTLLPFLPLTIGLKKVGEGQFKAVVPTGVPSDMDIPLIVVNGSIAGGATSVTIPAGSVESDILTVTRTPGTTAAVIVDLERVVQATSGSGYVFYKSSFPLELFSPLAGAPTAVSERTPQIVDAIVGEVPEINHIHHNIDLTYVIDGKFVDRKYNTAPHVSEAHLAAITSLNVPGSSSLGGLGGLAGNWFSTHGNITALKLGDFDGMSNLTSLDLDGNELSALPDSLFDKLTNLTSLALSGNELSALPTGIFDKLTNLTTLSLSKNQLSALPTGIFDKLTNLTSLDLSGNELSALPTGIFDKLTNLTYLNLLDNPLRSLPDDYFDNLTNLETLFLPPTITPPALPGADAITPLVDRTLQVRNAIVAAVPGINSAADVTAAHLAAIRGLDLRDSNITALKSGDFDDLINLEGLIIRGTQLTSLPAGIFDNLSRLKALIIDGIQLTSLPAGIFDNLVNLRTVLISGTQSLSDDDIPDFNDDLNNIPRAFGIIGTQLSALPEDIFDSFTNMPAILLNDNQLRSLPDGIFDKATWIVDLSNNQLRSLPDGIFEGIFTKAPDLTGYEILGIPLGQVPEDRLAELGVYSTVKLTGNTVDPLPLTISLKRVGTGQFKAVALAGAPFEFVLPLRVANGNISGGATSITIPVGGVESETFTVTRTPGTTLAVTVGITLPALPTTHTGYTLTKSADLPLVFTEYGGGLPVSERTPEVRDAIVRAVPGINSAANVTEAHLAAITDLRVDLSNAVKVGDFDGLTGLLEFRFIARQLTSIPAGLFDDLTNVTELIVQSLNLTTLPDGTFDALTNVTSMTFHMFQLTSLPEGIFDPFTQMTECEIYIPKLTSLPDGIFDQLTNLTGFNLFCEQLTNLPDGIFDQLTNLTGLSLACEQLTNLPDGVFDQLTNLTSLGFNAGQLTSLPDNLFDQLTNLTYLRLSGSQLTSILDDIKWPTTLTSLGLYSNQLSTLPDDLFTGLPSLTSLNLNNNNLTSLPADIFSELPNLKKLYIDDNQLSTLPDGLFSGLSSLTSLKLSGNAVDPLPLTVSLKKVVNGQFKAVVPTGAPFDIVLPLTVANGSISGGATSITIPVGSVESSNLTVKRTTGTTAAVTVNIGTLPGVPSEHSGYALVKSTTDLPLTLTPGGPNNPPDPPLSERTPQVRDAIVAAVPGVNSANDVTETHLAAIKTLNLIEKSITSLKSGDFDGLTGLTWLRLNGNPLTSLPKGAFSGLSSLKTLSLHGTYKLTSLPADVFSGLTSLTTLELNNNKLASLPKGVFSNLTALQSLWLSSNALTDLPADVFNNGLTSLTTLYLNHNDLTGLPKGVFSGLTSLKTLWLYNNKLTSLPKETFSGLTSLESLKVSYNRLTSLPDDIFEGLTSLTTLSLAGNAVNPLPFTISLKKVADGQFKAVAPIGAPFDIVLPLNVTNGSVTGGATSITIAKGSTESGTLTITRTPGTIAAVTVNIGTLPGLPSDHSGYTLVKSTTGLPLTLTPIETNNAPVFTDGTSTTRSIAENTASGQNIGTAIAATDADTGDTLTYTLSGTDASSFSIVSTSGQLRTKSALDYETKNSYSVTVSVSDGNGGTDSITVTINVTDVTERTIDPPLSERTPEVRDAIVKAAGVNSANEVTEVHLAGIWQLDLEDKSITSLKVGDFEGLTALRGLFLRDNQLTTLPVDIFDGLTALTTLNLEDNKLSTLPAGIFADLTELNYLTLADNQLTMLPSGILEGPSALWDLWLDGNRFTKLPAGIFKGVSSGFLSLRKLYLEENTVDPLPLTLSLEKVANGQFKAVAPAGAPFDIVLPLTVTHGSISGGASNTTISKGSTEGGILTITRTPSTTAAVTVNIGILPGLPSSHEGYELLKSTTDLPLTVIDAPQNRAPVFTDGTGTTRTIAENTASGQNIGTAIAATDADSGDTLTYILSGTDASSFSIVSTSGQLQTKAALDYETKNSYSLTITVSDGNGGSDSITVTINVTDVNENHAPVFTDGTTATRSIAENTASGQNIGTAIAATDADTGDTLTYTLTGTDASSFSIVSTSGQLQTKAALDYETKTSYSMTVSVSDGNGGSDSITVTINVTDIDEISVDTDEISVDTVEVIPAAPGICKVGDILAPGQSCTYPGTDTEFSVSNSGIGQFLFLTAANNLNIKNTELNGVSYTLIAKKLASGSWEIEEIGANTARATANTAPIFTDGTSTTRSIAENTASGQNIGTAITATDADSGDTLTYTLGGTDAAAFSIVSTTGQLQTKAALDYETKTSYSVTITVSDGSATDTISVTINVIDVNDTVIISARVPVANRTPAVRDAIVNAVPNVNNAADVTAAHLAAITSLNLRNAGITALQADDFSGMTALTTLNLFNNQLSRLPPGIFAGLTSLTTIRLGQNAIDPLPITVSLEKVGEGAFKAVAPAGATFNYVLPITVANGTINGGTTTLTIPHGSIESNTLRVTRTAGTTGHVTVDIATFPRLPRTHYGYALTKSDHLPLVAIRGINTAPVFSDGTTATRSVAENTAAGQNIGTAITATDADNDTLTYTLSGPDAAAFGINSTTGQLQTKATLDYETKTSYSVTVSVSDGNGGNNSVSVTINVTDIRENRAPVFTDGTTTTRTIAENTAANTNIGTAITATDADNDTLTYTLSGTDAASFSILGRSGQLQTRAALDYETKNAYTVTVTVSDGSATDTITVTINITDVNELPTTTATCKVGDVLAPGESCTYPGTDAVFSVLGDGTAQWHIPNLPTWLEWINQTAVSGSLRVSATVNGQAYHFVAEQIGTFWKIKEIGDDRSDPQPEETPADDGTPTLAVSTAAPLTETTLHEGIVTLTLTDGTYERSTWRLRDAVSVAGITGIALDTFDTERISDTKITVKLEFDGNINTDSTLTITLDAGAIVDYNGAALTTQIAVTAVTESVTASTVAPLTEATLDESVVTLTLSGRKFERYNSTIRPAVSVSGISGVTVGTFDIDRQSDTEVTVELTFNGNMNADGTLTFTVGADAIAGYNGPALIVQVAVAASTETPVEPETPEVSEPPSEPSTVTEKPIENDYDHIEGPWLWMIAPGGDINTDNLSKASEGVITETQIAQNGVNEGDHFNDLQWTSGRLLPTTVCGFFVCSSDNVIDVVKEIGLTDKDQLSYYSAYALINISSPRPQNNVLMGVGSDDSIKVWLNGSVVYKNSASRRTTGIQNQFPVNLNAGNNLLLIKVCNHAGLAFNNDWGMFFKLYLDTEDYTLSLPIEDPNRQQTVTPEVTKTPEQPQQPEQPEQQPGNTDGTPTLTVSTAAPLTEATLPGGIVTLTLTGSTYEQSSWRIRDAITVSGISGVTFRSFDIDRESDTEVTVELTYDGNMTADGMLTFTVGAGAIQDYDGAALTTQIAVPAVTESITASTTAPLTEATLDESIVTLTLSGRKFEPYNSRIEPAVSVSGISGVTVRSFDIDRESDTEVTVELTYDGNMTADGMLTFTVGAGAIQDYDGAALTTQIAVPAVTESITASTTAPLTEATLDESVVTLTLRGRKFEPYNSTIRRAVSVSGISGVTVRSFDIDRESDTEVTVELTFNGNMNADGTLTVTVGPGAIAGYNGPALTAQVSVSAGDDPVAADQTPEPPDDQGTDPPEQPEQPQQQPGNTGGTPTLTVSTASPLTEATLHGGIVTLTLTGGTYERSSWRIREAVTVSGISGVTVDTFDVDRVNDTKITVELTYDGNMSSNGTLTISVGAGAIKDYDGGALTGQITVSAVTESITASTASPLKEATLDESVITLTLSGRKFERWNSTIRGAVSVSGISGVTVRSFDIDRESDTEVTVELTFNGNMNADGTLTVTVGADAIAGYNGPALTAQVSVSAGDAPATNNDDQTPEPPDNQDTDPPEQPEQPENTGGTPTLAVSTAASLTETTLNGAVVSLNLSGGTFERAFWNFQKVSVSGITGVTFDDFFDVDRESATQLSITLTYDGNMTTNGTLTFTVEADAIQDYSGASLTAQIAVSAVTESVTASPSTLTEATLDGTEVSITLSGRKFERSIFDIRGAVSVAGIAGATIPWHQPRRKSDTEITVELEFDGDMTTDGTLTFTVGADAIAGYNGPALTAQISVTADRENILLANFPNPFNPETWIPYQLAKPTEVTITIYAANGQVVRTLALGHQPAGFYYSRSRAAYWDGRNAVGEPVASGVYFYTIIAGDFTATRKMLIRK